MKNRQLEVIVHRHFRVYQSESTRNAFIKIPRATKTYRSPGPIPGQT